MTKTVSFFSTCPVCGQQQLQLAYKRRALFSLLKSGNIIDAYCLACDVVWPISAQERNSVATVIAAGQSGTTPLPRLGTLVRPQSVSADDGGEHPG